MNRRLFLSQISLALLISNISKAGSGESHPHKKRILLRSSWQTVNIGDIGHTPGMLALLEKNLPDVEVQLWPTDVSHGIEEMLLARFPKLKIVKDPESLKQAFAECDFLLHGSGPSLVAEKHVQKWRSETGKPYGIAGITFSSSTPETIALLSNAAFVYFRDSVSLAFAKEHGCTCPTMAFGPDGAFSVDLRNERAAEAFLKANGLEEGRFLCVIPRLRYTPYWKIHGRPVDETKHARNEAMKEHDHVPLRDAIVRVARETSMKILVCPEDQSQMEIGKELLVDKLPEDVRSKVIWRESYWLTDEALSVYIRSAGLFGNEMHSPIMCIGNGIPAVVCRWQEQTSKGIMWNDIGLQEWLFDFDQDADLKRVAKVVLEIAKDPATAKQKVLKAQALVHLCQNTMVESIATALRC